MIHAFVVDDSGQSLVEYSLIIALVCMVAIVAMKSLGRHANNTLNSAAAALS